MPAAIGSRLVPGLMAAALVLVVAGCIPAESLPATCNDPTVSLHAELHGEQLTPNRLDVCRDQGVMLTITSDQAGILHLHGYDDQAPAQEIRPGGTARFAFNATRTGQFVLELHRLDAPAVDLAILTVHEH
jgi:hypothetical protein